MNAQKGLFGNFSEIEYLIREFESGTLPRGQWTHGAHLAVACWYLLCYQDDEATRRIRDGIRNYNDAAGILTTRDSGYHETITLFWIWLIKDYLSTVARERSIVWIINNLLTRYSDQRIPFHYYSRDLLLSSDARTRWIDPDLNPLPSLP
jgi:hypothetical protein